MRSSILTLAVCFILAMIFISWLLSIMMEQSLKKVMNYGTRGTTGKQIVQSYLSDRGNGTSVKIEERKKSVVDYYDMPSRTLYLSLFSVNSFSLYYYLNPLRQMVIACIVEQHKILYAIKTALCMLFRLSGVVTLVLMICSWLFQKPILLMIACAELSAFFIWQVMNTCLEYSISKKAFIYSKIKGDVGEEEMKIAKQFYRGVDFAEWTMVWKGISSVIMLLPMVIKDMINYKKNTQKEGCLQRGE